MLRFDHALGHKKLFATLQRLKQMPYLPLKVYSFCLLALPEIKIDFETI